MLWHCTEKTARLHDALKAGGYTGHALELYLVRLLFCFFAEDTGLFPQGSFRDLVANTQKNAADLPGRLAKLFEVLNTPGKELAKKTLLPEWFRQFRYVNGGLFADLLPAPDFSAAMRGTLLDCCDFDWSAISPAIFGAMFQGVMDAKARRELGAHYTSEENILKVIRPLFLDALWEEFERARVSEKALREFHDKIARLRFLDPACGCGNFLIVAYRELRILELEIVKMLFSGQLELDIKSLLKVSVAQFAGIEIEDFPCQIARVGMWLMDHLMNLKAAEEFGRYLDRLPLTTSTNIVHGNALAMDWNDVVPKEKLSYIFGNPPFVGKKEQSAQQKKELVAVFGNEKGVGNLDYVCAWYGKSATLIRGTSIRAAFVSTNAITQGEQAPVLWSIMLDKCGAHIDFAHRTFRWDAEAKGKAHVHCVIVGFSTADSDTPKLIFDGGERREAKHINGYLVDAPNVIIQARSNALCHDAPPICYGSMPIDNGNLILGEEDVQAIIAEDGENAQFIKEYAGGVEFIQNRKRWCLWLKDAPPAIIRKSPLIRERVENTAKFRRNSTRPQTLALAETPFLFGEIRQPDTPMLVIPKVSSENRKYIPIVLTEPSVIVNGSALIVPNATLYHFGALCSSTHNAWMRAVAGRLEMRYQYSNNIVYNNFPWPDADEAQRAAIEKKPHRPSSMPAPASPKPASPTSTTNSPCRPNCAARIRPTTAPPTPPTA